MFGRERLLPVFYHVFYFYRHLNTSKLKYLDWIADKNVTLQQLNIKNKAQWSAMGMKSSVHPLYPTISCTHLIIVYVNEDLTVILRSFGTMNHIRFCRSTIEQQQFKDGKTESLHTQLWTCQMSHFSYNGPVITLIMTLCCVYTFFDLQVVTLLNGGWVILEKLNTPTPLKE